MSATPAPHRWLAGVSAILTFGSLLASPLETNTASARPIQDLAPQSSIRCISFVNERTGWAVGEGGIILETSDGGHSWRQQFAPTSSTLNGLFARNELEVWAVGDSGMILHTVDGEAWTRVEAGIEADLYSVLFSTESNGTVVDRDGVPYVTNDGGLTWSARPVPGSEGEPSAEHRRRRPVRRPAPPDTLVHVRDVAHFQGPYGVSGTATVVSERLLRLSGFRASGTAPGMDVRIGLSGDSRREFRILQILGRQAFSDATFDLPIPSDLTLDDFDTITIWCFEFDVLIAEGRFQSP